MSLTRTVNTAAAPASGEAERARLIDMAKRYLAALASGDPRGLPLAPQFRSTEDTQTLPIGAGVWRTIRSLRPGGHYFVDPDSGQVEFWGVVDEMGEPAILALRLKIEGGRYAEAETIMTRRGAMFDPEMVLEPGESFHRVLAPEERASRAELIGAAHRYFDAIELRDGSGVAVAERCRRLVNGAVDSVDADENLIPGEEHRGLPVVQQIDEGYYAYIEALRERRFPIVDVERGLVLCHVIFDHPGDLRRAGEDLPFRSPNSMPFTEIFKVVSGTIEEVWALGTAALPYGIASGW